MTFIIMTPPAPPQRREIVKDGIMYREVLPGDDATGQDALGFFIIPMIGRVVDGCWSWTSDGWAWFTRGYR